MFNRWRAARSARSALRLREEQGADTALRFVEVQAQRLGASVWAHYAVELASTERADEARGAIKAALRLEPNRGDALRFLARLERDQGRHDEAVEGYRTLLQHYPTAALEACDLASLLAMLERHDEAAAVMEPFARHELPEVRATCARMLASARRSREALDVLETVVKELRLQVRGLVANRLQAYEEMNDLGRLYDSLYAEVHGAEKVVESPLAQGNLDAHAGVNYHLLGEARMVDDPPWTADLTLRNVEATREFGQALIAAGETSRGHCHLGVAALRHHLVDRARKEFERARDLDDRNFAAYLGLGASLNHRRHRHQDRVGRLPAVENVASWTSLAAVVPAFDNLTDDEKKVVALSIGPLRAMLPAMAAAGARMSILPIDARLVDLPEFADEAGERTDDHRVLDAITGAANLQIAASKIETLMAVEGPSSMVFAHEFAHLAFFYCGPEVEGHVVELLERAQGSGFIGTDYQRSNADEFFAIGYTEFLAQQWDLPEQAALDDEGVMRDLFDLIESLRGS